jgi:hypothetical protein
METTNCKWCDKPLDPLIHGNRKYCDEHCYYLEKLNRQQEKRNREYEIREDKKRSEKILEKLLIQHGEGNWLNAQLVEIEQFDFSISDGIRFINGHRAIVIGNHAYIMMNLKMSIYKL